MSRFYVKIYFAVALIIQQKFARNTTEDGNIGRFCRKLSESVDHADHNSGFKYVCLSHPREA